MQKEFIPYQQALELKELGYNENYIACYSNDSKLHQDEMWKYRDSVKAPLYQQAFRWFREKYDLYPYIIPMKGEWVVLGIMRCTDSENIIKPFDVNYKTHEEAELACLNKLIGIAKTK